MPGRDAVSTRISLTFTSCPDLRSLSECGTHTCSPGGRRPKKPLRAGDRSKRLIQADPPRKPVPAVVGPAWAARQGAADGTAGKACLSYKTFLRVYELHKSDASRHLWNIYHEHAKPAPSNISPPKPMQKSRWTRGLSLGDAPTSRRTVRRCDRIEPRRSDLSPENAALLMKVNQQNTLVDMWR